MSWWWGFRCGLILEGKLGAEGHEIKCFGDATHAVRRGSAVGSGAIADGLEFEVEINVGRSHTVLMDFDSDDVVAFNECSARQWVFEETSSIIARGGSQGGAVDEEARGEVVPFDFLPIEINDGRIIAFEAQDQAANVGDICDGEIFPIIGGNPFVPVSIEFTVALLLIITFLYLHTNPGLGNIADT